MGSWNTTHQLLASYGTTSLLYTLRCNDVNNPTLGAQAEFGIVTLALFTFVNKCEIIHSSNPSSSVLI